MKNFKLTFKAAYGTRLLIEPVEQNVKIDLTTDQDWTHPPTLIIINAIDVNGEKIVESGLYEPTESIVGHDLSANNDEFTLWVDSANFARCRYQRDDHCIFQH